MKSSSESEYISEERDAPDNEAVAWEKAVEDLAEESDIDLQVKAQARKAAAASKKEMATSAKRTSPRKRMPAKVK